MAFLIIIGLGVYVGRYIKDGEMWALYFDQSTSSSEYTLTDRNGTPLAKWAAAKRAMPKTQTPALPATTLQATIPEMSAPARSASFKSKLSGFSLITGIEEQDDVNLQLTIDADSKP